MSRNRTGDGCSLPRTSMKTRFGPLTMMSLIVVVGAAASPAGRMPTMSSVKLLRQAAPGPARGEMQALDVGDLVDHRLEFVRAALRGGSLGGRGIELVHAPCARRSCSRSGLSPHGRHVTRREQTSACGTSSPLSEGLHWRNILPSQEWRRTLRLAGGRTTSCDSGAASVRKRRYWPSAPACRGWRRARAACRASGRTRIGRRRSVHAAPAPASVRRAGRRGSARMSPARRCRFPPPSACSAVGIADADRCPASSPRQELARHAQGLMLGRPGRAAAYPRRCS